MLLIKHFATFIFASLVFRSTVQAMPPPKTGKEYDATRRPPFLLVGSIYQADVSTVEPNVFGAVVCVLPIIQRNGDSNVNSG
jgi:hypothetical protein